MGLFTQVIKKGAKVVDGLLDDTADAGKKVVDGFDEAEWERLNPRPEGSAYANPEVKRWMSRRNVASKRAEKEGYDSIGNAIKPDHPFDEEGWLKDNPQPFPEIRNKDLTPDQRAEYDRHKKNKSDAKKRSTRDDHDSVGRRIPDEWEVQWEKENPKPEGPPTQQDVINWHVRKGYYRDHEETLRKDREKRERNAVGVKERQQRYGNSEKGKAKKKEYSDKKQQEIVDARAGTEGYDDKGRPIKPPTNAETNFTVSKRRALRTPPWVDLDGLLGMKDARRAMELDSGIRMDGDHSTPLLGDLVSGLDIPSNIQIMPADWHREFGARVGLGKNSLLYTPEARNNMYQDHLGYIAENADDIAYRTREKKKAAAGLSDQLDMDILNPHTKIGRNARKLWGDDTQKHLDYYRKELGLLGV